jgi:hypothetical protein
MGCASGSPAGHTPEYPWTEEDVSPLQQHDTRGAAIWKLLHDILHNPPLAQNSQQIAGKYKSAAGSGWSDIGVTVFRQKECRNFRISSFQKEMLSFETKKYDGFEVDIKAVVSQTGERLQEELQVPKLEKLMKRDLTALSQQYEFHAPLQDPPWNRKGIAAYKCKEVDSFVGEALKHEFNVKRPSKMELKLQDDPASKKGEKQKRFRQIGKEEREANTEAQSLMAKDDKGNYISLLKAGEFEHLPHIRHFPDIAETLKMGILHMVGRNNVGLKKKEVFHAHLFTSRLVKNVRMVFRKQLKQGHFDAASQLWGITDAERQITSMQINEVTITMKTTFTNQQDQEAIRTYTFVAKSAADAKIWYERINAARRGLLNRGFTQGEMLQELADDTKVGMYIKGGFLRGFLGREVGNDIDINFATNEAGIKLMEAFAKQKGWPVTTKADKPDYIHFGDVEKRDLEGKIFRCPYTGEYDWGVAEFACNDLNYSLKHKVLLEMSEHAIEDSRKRIARFPFRPWLEDADPPLDREGQMRRWIETEPNIVIRWLKLRMKSFNTEGETRKAILEVFAEVLRDEAKFVKWVQKLATKFDTQDARIRVTEILRVELVSRERLPEDHPDSEVGKKDWVPPWFPSGEQKEGEIWPRCLCMQCHQAKQWKDRELERQEKREQERKRGLAEDAFKPEHMRRPENQNHRAELLMQKIRNPSVW